MSMRPAGKIFSVLLAMLVVGIPATAQTSGEQVDVRSIEFTYIHFSSAPRATITAVSSNGQEKLVYRGDATINLPPLLLCDLCAIPNSFSTNVFGSRLDVRIGLDRSATIFVTSVNSDPVSVSPRYTWKRKSISFTGKTTLTGRMEVQGNPGVVTAYDPDISVEGSYAVSFVISVPVPPNGRRRLSFDRIDLALSQPVSQEKTQASWTNERTQ